MFTWLNRRLAYRPIMSNLVWFPETYLIKDVQCTPLTTYSKYQYTPFFICLKMQIICSWDFPSINRWSELLFQPEFNVNQDSKGIICLDRKDSYFSAEEMALKVLIILNWQKSVFFLLVDVHCSMTRRGKYSQVPIKRVGPNKRVGWIFIKYSCLSLCLFLSSCFFGAK